MVLLLFVEIPSSTGSSRRRCRRAVSKASLTAVRPPGDRPRTNRNKYTARRGIPGGRASRVRLALLTARRHRRREDLVEDGNFHEQQHERRRPASEDRNHEAPLVTPRGARPGLSGFVRGACTRHHDEREPQNQLEPIAHDERAEGRRVAAEP